MADRIKGITVEIGGDVTGLNKALSGTNKEIKSTQNQLKDVERLLKLDPNNTVLLEQKQRLLGNAVKENVSKLDTLKKASEGVTANNEKYEEWTKSFSKIQEQTTKAQEELSKLQQEQKKFTEGSDDYNRLQSEIDATTDKISNLKKQAADTFDELGRPISTDQYDALQREIISTTEDLRTLEGQASKSQQALSKISNGADKVAEASGKVSKSMAPATVAITGLGIAAFNSASDLEESQNKVDVAFGKSADVVKNFASEALEKYGMAKGTALDMAAQFGDMGTSMGLTTVQAAEMSTSLVGLAGDLASFKNIGTDQAMTALNGIFTGESQSLKTLGIVMTQDTLLSYALANGFIDTAKSAQDLEKQQIAVEKAQAAYNVAVRKHGEGSLEARDASLKLSEAQSKLAESGAASLDSLSEAEKVQLRYAFVMNATKNAHGDFANTSEGAANSLRIMQESIKDASAELGGVLLPVITPIIQKITEMITWFTTLDDGQKRTIVTVLALIAAISPVAGLVSGIATVVGAVIPIIGTVSGAIAILTGAATTGTAASTALANGISFLTSPIGLVIAAIIAAVALIATKGDEIQAVLQKLDDWLQGVFTTDWTTIFGPVLGSILNGFFANVKNVWDSIKTVFDGIIDFIRGVFTGDWKRAWNGIVEIFSGLFGMIEACAKAPLNGIIGLLNGAIGAINQLIGGLNGIGFELPGWLGGGSFKINIPSIPNIPYLAKGGILSAGSAVVGEDGPELLTVGNGKAVVQPLSGNNGHLDSQVGGPPNGGQGVIEIVVPVSLDGRIVGEGAYRYIQQRERAHG